MPLIIPANTLLPSGYNVANSCRFDGSSSSLNLAPGAGGSLTNATYSFWLKKCKNGAYLEIFHHVAVNSNSNFRILFASNDKLYIINEDNTSDTVQIFTNRLFRDVSAWYHIVIAIDTTDGTAGDRVKIYVNGVRETSFATENTPDEDEELQINGGANTMNWIGQRGVADDNYYNGYMAEVVYINGTTYAASDFGEFSEDSPTIWIPKDVSGLTFGTNGFYLDFEASANLGNDANGGSDFAENGIAAADQMTDTPTNNFATLNPLYAPTSNPPTYSEGNLKSVTNTTSGEYGWGGATTIGVTSGKWYCEAKATVSGTSRSAIGVHYDPAEGARDNSYSVNEDYAWGYHSETGVLENDNATVWDGNAYVTDDIIGIYLDLDNHKLYIAKNGTLENSGTGASLTTGKTYHFYQEDVTGGTDHSTFEFNFGAGSSWAVSSGNADANGYGNFEYDPSAGSFDSASKDFYALNTKNLAEYG